MKSYILAGCDLHDKTMLLKVAHGTGRVKKHTFENNPGGLRAMVHELKKRATEAGGAQCVLAYEASCLGYVLYDELSVLGITCHVLAPSKIERSAKQHRCKTDEKDAERILEILKGHYLAGNSIPDVWIPDHQTRDDREVVRARLDVQEKCSMAKTQVRTLLKRNGVALPKEVGSGWTKPYRAWLKALTVCDEPLRYGARQNLASLIRQMESLEQELALLDRELVKLAEAPRHKERMNEVTKLKGVGIITAIVFLTEMGDLKRFKNRRQVGAFLGLVPSSNETGESDDRKGHITHQGPARVRYVLNQAVWNRVRFDATEKKVYDGIVARNPKHKKIAVVAAMRRLAIRMWHAAQGVKAVA